MPRILQTKRAAAQAAALPAEERAELFRRLAGFGEALGNPHIHSGMGMRMLEPGCMEIRVNLRTRAVLIRDGDDWILYLVGNHEDVRRFLKGR